MLANAQAVQGRTELDVNRYTPLAKEQAASQQDLDNAVQKNLAAKATVETAKALFSAQLTLAQARGDEYQSLVQLYRSLGGGWQP